MRVIVAVPMLCLMIIGVTNGKKFENPVDDSKTIKEPSPAAVTETATKEDLLANLGSSFSVAEATPAPTVNEASILDENSSSNFTEVTTSRASNSTDTETEGAGTWNNWFGRAAGSIKSFFANVGETLGSLWTKTKEFFG